MLKTAVIGKTVNGATQLTRIMAISGDKIILVDATTGQPPKKVTTKIVDKDLHVFADGATEPSVIVSDYALYDQTIQISGLGSGGEYVNYGVTATDTMELGGVSPIPAPSSAPFMSTSAWWGVGILAVAGGVVAAAGGGGGGSSTTAPSNPVVVSTTHTATLVDSIVSGVTYTTSSGLGGVTGSDGIAGSFNYKAGDIVTFKVGNATIGTFNTASINATDHILTIQEIAGVARTNTTDPKVVKIAQFLQSLDSVGNATDGITIDSAKAALITSSIEVQTANDTALQTALTPANITLVTEAVAKENLAIIANDTTPPTATITLSDTVLNSGETATVTIKFSEAVAGFTNADVTVANGTLSPLSTIDNITWTATFTPTASLTAATNVISISNTYTDVAGNAGTAAISGNYAVDTHVTPPPQVTVTITDDEGVTSANIAGGEIIYTFTFSEAVHGFSLNGITVTNGTAGVFKQASSTVYTLSVIPDAINSGEVAVNVKAGSATNSIGTPNEAAYTSYQAVDMVAPSVTSVTLADTALTIGETSAVTITFSEAVKNFSNANIDLTGAQGTLSTLTSSDNITWTGLFTPTATTTDASNVIRVLSTYTDMAGNAGALGASGNVTIDTRANPVAAPTFALTTDDGVSITDGITHTNGVTVSGVAVGNIWEYSLNGGTTWNPGTGTTFNLVANTSYAPGQIEVRQTDTNSNVSTIATNTQTTLVDTTAPTVAITSDQVGTANIAGGDIVYTFTFSEEVSGFAIGDVTVGNGTKGAFAQISPSVYTLVVTPTATGDVSVDVAANGATDTAGNGNSIAITSHQAVDLTAPSVTSIVLTDTTPTTPLSDGALTYGETENVTITFSEAVTNFDNTDVSLAGAKGTVGTLTSSDNKIWTGIFTPTANTSDASNIIQVLNTYTDVAGNAGTAKDSPNFTIDTRPTPIAAPAFALTTNDGVSVTDGITHTNGVTVTLAAGITNWEYSLDGGGAWTTGIATTFNVIENISYAPGQIQVRQTDTSGHVSTIATNTQTTLVDTISPKLLITNNQGDITANMDGSNGDATSKADGADILYTFKFDEVVKDFTAGDIVVTHGTAKTFTANPDGMTYTLGVTPEVGYEGNMTVSVLSTVYHDVAGNVGNVASDTLSVQAVDMLAPVLNDTVFDGVNDWIYDYTNKTITFTLNSPLEAVNMANPGGFDVYINTHLIPVEAIAMIDNQVTLIMPKAIADDFTNIESVRVVYKDVTTDLTPAIQDLAGNDATSFTYLKPDVTPPTVTSIFFNDPSLSIGQSSLVTITFSEEVKDAVVSFANGTLSGLTSTANARVWTATFTPSANVEFTSNVFSVGAGDYHDLNGLAGTTTTDYTYYIDTSAPSVSITDDEPAAVANITGGNIKYTFTFSEPVTGFTLQDITIAGGTPAGVLTTISSSVYTLDITPTAGIAGNVTVDIAAGAVTDLIGNSSTVALQSIQAVDMKAPTVVISINDTIVTAGETPTVTFTFSEAVLGFDVNDVSVGGGSLSNLSTADGGITYSSIFTPTIDGVLNTITLDTTLNGGYTDVVGNSGTGASSGNYIIDTQAPTINTSTDATDATIDANHIIKLHFSENLDAVNFAPTSMFQATNENSKDPTDNTKLVKYQIQNVQISGKDAFVSIDPSINLVSGKWTFTYTDTPGNDLLALQDIYGSDVSSFTYVTSVISV